MGTTGGASDGEAASANTYATLAQLRIISHFTEADISDADVNDLIPKADRAILRLATIEMYDEEMGGSIDDENKIFTTKYRPIADVNYDKTIDKNDVTVYLVDYDEEGNGESTEAEVNTVNARDGIVTLVAAPTSVYTEVGVFIDYRYYQKPVDYDMLALAANYYLAYLCEMRKPELETNVRWLDLAQSQIPFAKPTLEMIT